MSDTRAERRRLQREIERIKAPLCECVAESHPHGDHQPCGRIAAAQIDTQFFGIFRLCAECEQLAQTQLRAAGDAS